MNKRDAMNQIRQFGNRFDRFRKPQGGGDGNRNAPKRQKAAPKPASRKTNVFNEQVRYAFHGALQDLKSKPLATFLTVMVIAISLTLPSVCYMVYKNVNQAASQYYPSPQITVYLDKALDDNAAAQVVGQIQAEQGVEKVNYLSREEALGEFRNWSGFGGALDMLEENPLPAVAVVIPKLDFQGTDSLNTLRDRISRINGIDEVRMDDSWFARLAALTGPLHGEAYLSVQALVRTAQATGAGFAIRELLAQGRAIPAFGHPLYPHGDRRAAALLAQFEPGTIYREIRETAEMLTGEQPNIDFALAAMTDGFALPPAAPVILFAIARSVGWIAHILEQQSMNQLIRPRARYTGPPLSLS